MSRKQELDRMIQTQLQSRGVNDRAVLEAFANVDRQLFVTRECQRYSYADEALPIECGQTISQPFVVAAMTQALALSRKDRVLEIGTGSGYQTAILAEIAGEVYTIELIPALHEKAESLLSSLGYANVHAIRGDGYEGYPEGAPYDAIIVTAAPPFIPEKLVDQLKPSGRMVLPVGTTEQMLALLVKNADGSIRRKDIFPVIFVPMKKGGSEWTENR